MDYASLAKSMYVDRTMRGARVVNVHSEIFHICWFLQLFYWLKQLTIDCDVRNVYATLTADLLHRSYSV